MIKKLIALWVLCCGIIVPLAAQSRQGQRIFVIPVTGNDLIDNDRITLILEGKVDAWNHFTSPTREESDYILRGTTGPTEGARPGTYDLFLQLMDNHTQRVVYEESEPYTTFESLIERIDHMMRTIFTEVLPAAQAANPHTLIIHPQNDSWRNRLVYLGAGAVWALQTDIKGSSTEESVNIGAAIGGSVSAAWHFLRFMGIEASAVLNYSVIETIEEFSLLSLSVPLSLKYTLKPRRAVDWMFEFALGGALNLPLTGDDVKPAPLSVFAGFQPVYKITSAGAMVLNTRLILDLSDATVAGSSFRRLAFHLGLGYKHGFIDRK